MVIALPELKGEFAKFTAPSFVSAKYLPDALREEPYVPNCLTYCNSFWPMARKSGIAWGAGFEMTDAHGR